MDSGGPPADQGAQDQGPATDAGSFAFPTPIHHVIVLVKENHTLDNLFTGFPGADTAARGLLSTGKTVARPRAPAGVLASDIRHSHPGAVQAYAKGHMNGFDLNSQQTTTDKDPLLTFIQYEEDQVPAYWAYARHFVLCDHFFSTTLTQSTPGHFALWAAQAPMISNPSCPQNDTGCEDMGPGCFSDAGTTIDTVDPDTCAIRQGKDFPCFDVPAVVNSLPASLTWRAYGHKSATTGFIGTPAPLFKSLTRDRAVYTRHVFDQAQLVEDLMNGDQANITYAHIGGGVDEHPPDAICPGENFTVEILNAVMKGPNWKDTAVLLTWDDWGGFYDHVQPAVESCPNGDFIHPGFRLPLLVISAYARRSSDPKNPFVYKTVTEQSSVPRLVEDLFGLPRMHAQDAHARDEKAGSLLGVFDFETPDFDPLILQPRTCP